MGNKREENKGLNMENKHQDEYIVLIEKNGNRSYYKNGKLHREAGPAYVPSKLKEKYTGLKDQELYKKVFDSHYDPKMIVFRSNSPLYYIGGIEYKKRQFDKIVLALDLSDELSGKLLEKQDEYIVVIEKIGNRFYYKNGQLHREAGPAYVNWEGKEKFTGLEDQELYKKVFKENTDEYYSYVETNEQGAEIIKKLRPTYECYHLDGIEYSKAEFNCIIALQKAEELDKELGDVQAPIKKIDKKVKI
jgi:hypothetical protein